MFDMSGRLGLWNSLERVPSRSEKPAPIRNLFGCKAQGRDACDHCGGERKKIPDLGMACMSCGRGRGVEVLVKYKSMVLTVEIAEPDFVKWMDRERIDRAG